MSHATRSSLLLGFACGALVLAGPLGCELGESKLVELVVRRLFPEMDQARAAAEAELLAAANLTGTTATNPTATGQPALADIAVPVPDGIASRGPEAAKRVYYQFIDERGSVRFVERLDEIPPSWRDRVGFVEMSSPPPRSPAEAQRKRRIVRAQAQPVARTRLAAVTQSAPDVILYYAEWCPWCRKAKAYLNSRNIAFELRDIDNPSALAELVKKTGQRGIPVLDVDGKVLIGFDQKRLDRLFSSAS